MALQSNIRAGTLFIGDNLEVLRGIDTGTIDLVYLDPPFHSDREYVAPLNSKAAGQRFTDIWHPGDPDTGLKAEWLKGVKKYHLAVWAVCEAARVAVGPERWAYLIFMAVRLLEIHRILTPTGSCWLHCDWHADGWLRALMDAIFGAERLRNEVVWAYEKWTNAGTMFQRNHDLLLVYAKGDSWTFNKLYGERTKRQEDFLRAGYNLGSSGGTKLARVYDPSHPNVVARRPQWEAEGRAIYEVEPGKGKALSDVWRIPVVNSQSKESTKWRTQKPLALLERIILACSNEGDIVLDPFCGCATAMVAAQKLGRQWLGIDIDAEAQGVTIDRMREEAGLFDAPRALVIEPKAPERTDNGLHACEVLGLEFELAQQRSKVLTGRQKAAYRLQEYARLEGKCQGLTYANGSHLPCVNGGIWLPDDLMELDHVNPRARGGVDTEANLQLGCRSCNSVKSAHLKPPARRKRRAA